LQPPRLHTQNLAHGQEAVPVGADEVDHRLAVEAVAMKPNAAVEGETHPLAAARERTADFAQVQVMRPSTVAVPTGAAPPEKM